MEIWKLRDTTWSYKLEVKLTCSKQSTMCGMSRVLNNILTMANDLIINLKSMGTSVGFGSNELVKQFIEISVEF
jgi:hypothetical protein